MINVLADKYLYQISSFLPENVRLRLYDPEEGLPSQIDGIDAILIRTVTKITNEVVSGLPKSVRFIGTGSAGTDHVDTDLLSNEGIAFASAAGCNARSVAEYVATALLIWADGRDMDLSDCTVGIVGVGHAGSAVQQLLFDLGISVIAYDPPRALRDDTFVSAEPDEVLNSDILTFHTPLTSTGDHPTYHWLDSEKLHPRKFQLIINTSRGGVINEHALLQAQAKGAVKDMIIDVWENEPVFNDELARRSFIKTPHIAGYSVQAKLKASKIICDQLIEHFSLKPVHAPEWAAASVAQMPGAAAAGVADVLTSIHPILNYQEELVKLIGLEPAQKICRFNKLRAEYPLRDEFRVLDLPTPLIKKYPVLRKLLS